ncbi:MAG TPA: hydrogenase maturation protease [Spirochaetia bacterium]|nr:hydrogenase maturation protease [Spirochaetia bacterium]
MTIVAVGNETMGDDGIGPFLAGLVRERREAGSWPTQTEVLCADPTMAVCCAAEGTPVLVIDAADMGLEAGEWRAVSAREVLPYAGGKGSTHSMSVSQAIQMADALGCLDRLRILAVQWGSLEPGSQLSAPVRERVPAMLDWIEKEAQRWP